MTSRLNILVAGGFDPEDADALDVPVEELRAFCKALGYQIIEQGHNLLTGCQTELDRVVAEGASKHPEITDPKEKDEFRIVSYILEGVPRAHDIGTIIQSERADWDIGGLDPSPPEVIRHANAVVLMGGFYGTFKAANWARLDRIPLLPFFRFGGAAKEVYKVETNRLEQAYGEMAQPIEFDQVLRSVTEDWRELARDTVQLADKVARTRSVLVCMSFEEKPEYTDLIAAIKIVCKGYDFTAERIDETNSTKRVVPEILKQVKRSAFVIVDISDPKLNVYYELGFADGAGKQVILTAKKGTDLPFNVADIPVIFWDSFEEFKKDLQKRVDEMDGLPQPG